ncbi:MAG: ATP-binding cassette domain-containing protein [Bacteroidota bacterium]
MITFKNISKSFNGRKVLDNVSGEFRNSNTSLIIGASGTGKSVLLKCLVGLVQPDEGEVFFDGRTLYGSKKETKVIRREMGMLFQGSALFDSKSVMQNVRFPLDMMTEMSKEEKEDRVHFCLKRVGLENAAKKMPSELSGGMQKRVGIARAIVMNPKYLFCDEPNSGLDPQTSILIDDLISEITDEYEMTTVVVTHDMNSVLGIGEQIMFIYQGRKLWDGNSDGIMNSGVNELDDFVFANKTLRSLRKSVETAKG